MKHGNERIWSIVRCAEVVLIAIVLVILVFYPPYRYETENFGGSVVDNRHLYNNTTNNINGQTNYTLAYFLVNNMTLVDTNYSTFWFPDQTTYPFKHSPNTDEAIDGEVSLGEIWNKVNAELVCSFVETQCNWDVLSLTLIVSRTDFNLIPSVFGIEIDEDLLNMNITGTPIFREIIWVDASNNPRPSNLTTPGALGILLPGQSAIIGFFMAINEGALANAPFGIYFYKFNVTIYDNNDYIENYLFEIIIKIQ